MSALLAAAFARRTPSSPFRLAVANPPPPHRSPMALALAPADIRVRPGAPLATDRVTDRRRRGAAAVEFALVSPLLIMLCLGMMEFGRMMMVQEITTNAAREGARKAVLPGVTDADVTSVIESYFKNCGIAGHSTSVSPSTTAAPAGTPIKVTTSVPYNDVSWLPVRNLKWLQSKLITATCEMRKEEY